MVAHPPKTNNKKANKLKNLDGDPLPNKTTNRFLMVPSPPKNNNKTQIKYKYI